MYNTVCLCGSTKFLASFDEANRELSKRGLSIITISMALPKNEQGSEYEEGLKELLDLVHLNKILRADVVFIVGDGYIGHSTAREIIWASMQGKPIMTWEYSGGSWDRAATLLTNGVYAPNIIDRAEEVLKCSAISLPQHCKENRR